MRRTLTIILSNLIILELMMTGLGFCGHRHMHVDTYCSGYYHDEEVHGKHDHGDDDHHHVNGGEGRQCGETQECRTHTHCPCLGGFIGEFQMIFLVVTFYSERFQPLKSGRYSYAWSPLIFHPPQAA